METLEVVEQGRERTPRRGLTIAVAALVAVPLLVGWLIDNNIRDAETAALTSCVTKAEASADSAEARVASMNAYVRPSLGPDLPAATRRALDDLVAQQARKGLPLVRQARDTCAALETKPWHRAQRREKQAGLAKIDARLTVLETTATP